MATQLVVEWTRVSLRLALAEGQGARWHLRTVQSRSVASTDEIPDALRALLQTLKASPGLVIAVVPREQVITRLVKFPTVEAGELAQMAELYAKAQLPYSREQAVIDFHVLSQHEGFSTVAIIACQRDVVERQRALVQDAGLHVDLLTVSSWGVAGWYRQTGRAAADEEPRLIVNIDDARTDLVLIGSGRLLSSRSVGQGVQEWESGGDAAELLALEVERSRAAVRKELPGTEVRSVMLTGLGALAQWSDPLSERLNLPVIVVDGGQPFQPGPAPTATPMSPVVVGGVACSEPHGLLNLNPSEMRVQVRHRQQVRELAMVGALLMGVVALGSSVLGVQLVRQRRTALALEQALDAVGPAAKRAQEKTRATQSIRAILDERRRLALTLSGVLRATPPSVSLGGLAFERARGDLAIRGSADSTQTVFAYMTQLGQLETASGVELKYSTQRATSSGDRTDFELMLRVKHGEPVRQPG